METDATPTAENDINLMFNWNRAIHIQKKIDDSLLKELTPEILKLSQAGITPISVGLDSFGGSISALEALMGLLKTARQDGQAISYYCLATNSAFSAAALLLSFSDYAVAYPHSKILFHDIRFSELTDVTPDRALQTAKDLQGENDRIALRLAASVARRLIWVYIDKRSEFAKCRKKFSSLVIDLEPAVEEICPRSPDNEVDVLGFALVLYDQVKSDHAADLILKTLGKLGEWVFIEKIEKTIVAHEDSKIEPKLMDGINSIFSKVSAVRKVAQNASTSEKQSELLLGPRLQNDLRLFLEIVLRRASKDPEWTISSRGFEAIQRDFELIKGLKETRQINSVINLMLDYDLTFFGREITEELNATTTIEDRRKILVPYLPQGRLFWYFAVLLTRNLFDGENFIPANDAQLLGLIDEVVGGGPVESRREYRAKRVKEKPESNTSG